MSLYRNSIADASTAKIIDISTYNRLSHKDKDIKTEKNSNNNNYIDFQESKNDLNECNTNNINSMMNFMSNQVQNQENKEKQIEEEITKKQEEYQSLTDNNLKTFLDEKSEELRKSTSFALPPSDIGDIFSLTTEKSRERIFKRTSYFVKNILKDGVYDDDDKAFVDSENEINPI